MTDSQARLVDALCKIAATLALVVGGGWTLYTYFNARASEARTAAIEARKPFLAKRLEIYSSLAELSGELLRDRSSEILGPLATEAMKNEAMEKTQLDALRLLVLETGPLELVADDNVKTATIGLDKCFSNILHQCEFSTAVKATENVAHACRDSIGSGWEVNVSKSPVKERESEKLGASR